MRRRFTLEIKTVIQLVLELTIFSSYKPPAEAIGTLRAIESIHLRELLKNRNY